MEKKSGRFPRLKAAAEGARKNPGAALVYAAAGMVPVLLILGDLELIRDLSNGVLTSITLGILAIVTSILVRERSTRVKVGPLLDYVEKQRLNQSLADITPIVAYIDDLAHEQLYEVQSEHAKWEIRDGGKSATITKTQRLRITKDKVTTLDMVTSSDGRMTKTVGRYRLDTDEDWDDVRNHQIYRDAEGSKYAFLLKREHNRGDVLDWQFEREMVDSFLGDPDWVALRLRTPSLRPVMHVVWEGDQAPKRVRLTQEGQTARKLKVREDSASRFSVEEEVSGVVGTTATITWDWS